MFSCLFGNLNITVNKCYLKYYPKWLIKSKCIYNGVNFDQLEVKKNNKNKLCVAFFARLDEQKAPLIYIEIINKLINSYNLKNIRYLLAGTGDLMPQCQQLIKKYSLSSYIEISGWISDKSEFLNQVDLLVQPSRWEAFGLNIVEAAHFSIPAITSKVEGLPEVVLNGKTGFTCDVNNIEEFSKCAAYLLENPEILSIMGNNAREYVNNNFSLQLMTQNYINLYDNINENHTL
ncbi:glycosyltransferase [Providencia heimbachae ATCC 35613]|uniref:Glycosyltransferase n=1 Tax=Providencia heimbachae ATCC 35613 TaxID=1354272 RepID=A0A1B7JU59_9GAMM|nr:glycosyltransferase [Providencia heimbachae ATCC 35613]